jgi:magnesium chelatase accessory protein
MALDSASPPRAIVSLNGALLPFPGPLGPAAPALARALFLNPLALAYFQHRAGHPGAVARLISRTGSTIDEAGLAFYERLFQARGHLEGTIGLMAHWDLESLQRDLPALRSHLTLVACEGDRAVPPNTARDVQRLLPAARIVSVPDLGHLAHEEAPAEIAALVLDALQQG